MGPSTVINAERIRENVGFLAGIWLLWTFVSTLSYGRHYIEVQRLGLSTGWIDFLDWLACFYPWAMLTPAMCRLGGHFPVRRDEWKRSLVVLLPASVIACCLVLEITSVLHAALFAAFGQPFSLAKALWPLQLGEFWFEQFFFWSTMGAIYAVRAFQQRTKQAAQLALEKSQLETSLREAELEALRMRLNPHFLFNTLQNISVLAQQNPKLATSMLTRLGHLLRVALRRDAPSETTVKDEIALTQHYLAVEKMRFGDRLTILSEVAADTDGALIPSFLLQPLVENAVIHGLRGVSQAGRIAMRTERDGDRLVVTVADNGLGWRDHDGDGRRVGLGLSSTRERLNKMFPGQHEFTIQKTSSGETEVRIAIPFRLSSPKDESVSSEQPAVVNC
jgi:two-component system LytT family sensor kinase